jgi:CheY-like chemotaxis protein
MALVMIMEDEPTIAMVLEILLSEDGNEVVTAPNGYVGLERLKQTPAPDVVFVDLNMPIVNGRAVIEKMYSDSKLEEITIVILSGSLPDSNVLPPKGYYKALLTKPFDLDDVINMVEKLTNRKQLAV